MTSGNLARTLTPLPKNVPGPWNLFSVLLLLPEQASARTAQKVLQDYGLHVYSAASMAEATQVMRSTRLDLVIFDANLHWADQLAYLAPSTSWRGVAMALAAQGGNRPAPKRVHFTLPRPLAAGMLISALKAAYTSMAQHRIATYRHTVPARLVAGTVNHQGWKRTLHQIAVLNLSQTGLCLNAAEPLPHGASLSMNLTLPESSYSVHARGSIVWSHSNGRTGVAFDRSACPEMKKFQELLNGWLPPELGIAARI
jgi:PilZ domain